ncbi:MAG: 4Fe-4S dicluster domain-containing protein [Bacillota bacterium]
MRLLFDSQKCIGCHLCELACSAKKRGLFNPKLAHIKVSSEYIQEDNAVAVSLCTNCEKCVDSCPVGAITNDNGHLKLNHEICTECGMCVEVCPEQVINFKDGLVSLCDFCDGQPECVTWCPRQALSFFSEVS